MRKVVRCACSLLVLGFILSACANQDAIENENRVNESKIASDVIKTSISKNNYERYDLLMTKYINDTKIYGISVANGIYDKVQIEINGKTKEFDWLSLADDAYLPYITYGDVNCDEVNECIIIMNEDLGDGQIRQHVYILNPETLEEIEIDSALEYISSHLSVKQENELVIILLDDLVVYTVSEKEMNSKKIGAVEETISEDFKENEETVINDEDEIDNEEHNENIDVEQNTLIEENVMNSNQEIDIITADNILEHISYLDSINYKVNGNLILVNVKFYLDNEEINTLDINYVFEDNKMVCKP